MPEVEGQIDGGLGVGRVEGAGLGGVTEGARC